MVVLIYHHLKRFNEVLIMHDLLCKFESLVILQTMMDLVDLNFIDTVKLNQIADTANELDIDLNYIDYDKIMYESDYDLMVEVFEDWAEDINTMYLDVKSELLKLIKE